MTRRLVALGLAAMMAAACGQDGSPRADSVPATAASASATATVLTGHHWELRTVTQQGKVWAVPQNPGLWLTFGTTTWSGQDGCNDGSGSATYTAAGVQLTRTSATTFACHGDDSNRMVTAFAALLQAPATVALHEGLLSLAVPGVTLTFRDTSAAPSADSLLGKLAGWYWQIRSTSINGVTTVAPDGSGAAINFTDQQFDASDDCGRDYAGDESVVYTDETMTLPPVLESAVGCQQTPLDTAYSTVLQSGDVHVALEGATLTLTRGGATLVYTRGAASAYRSNFLAGAPTLQPPTDAQVAASVAGATWRLDRLDRGTEDWLVPASYPTRATFGATSFTLTYGCVTWTGPIVYTALGATTTTHKTTGECPQTDADLKVDAAVTLLLGDTFTTRRDYPRILLLTGGGVYLSLVATA